MSRPNPALLPVFLVAIVVILGGMELAKGGFYFTIHEGDMLHLVDILLRMEQGQRVHVDFMTPIGIAALAPFVVFLKAGAGIGHALLLGQVLVAVLILPALWWVAFSRFPGRLGYLFGFVVLVLILALIAGDTKANLSMSLHYNRWAWALSFLVIPTAVFAARRGSSEVADGVVIGLAMAVLALCKATFFLALAIPVVAALLLRGAGRTLGAAIACGLLVAVVLTLVLGMDHWYAYVGDLMQVQQSPERVRAPSMFLGVITAPAYVGGTLVLLASIVILRFAGQRVFRTALILLIPSLFYLTFQNFGNDPKWLLLLSIMLFSVLPPEGRRGPRGTDLREAFLVTATAAFALAAASFLSLAATPFWHFSAAASEYEPIIDETGRHSDLLMPTVRTAEPVGMIDLAESGSATATGPAGSEGATVDFRGESLVECALLSGIPSRTREIARDLAAGGETEGRHVFVADRFSGQWIFAPLKPLPQGAPWYYGGLPGYENADFLLVPLCPASPNVRRKTLDAITALGGELTEVRRNPLFILYEKVPE